MIAWCTSVLAATGCAVVPEPTATPAPVPPAQTPTPVASTVGTTASGGNIASRAPEPALVDTSPSGPALEVLGTIAEPIPAADRVPPPDDVLRRYPPSLPRATAVAAGSAVLLADASGTARDSVAADSAAADTGFVPVPKPTKPLGQRRRVVPAVDDSLMRAAMGDTAGADTTLKKKAATPVHPDSCWRVQVAAPLEAQRAADLRRAAESLLLMPMVVEEEEGRHKVRTRDCMGAVNADRLRRRADASGFEGAFRFRKKR